MVPLADPHLDRLREALKSEERFARAEHARLSGLPLVERVAQGFSWAGVTVEQTVALRSRELRVVVRGQLHEGIRAGDPVVVRGTPGRCVGWDDAAAELRFDRTTWEAIEGSHVIDLGFDATTWIRYRKALEQADELDSALKSALLVGPEDDPGEHRRTRDLNPAGPTWAGLNASQLAAAQQALDAQHLAVIHGPPGTGKTRTLVALLARLPGTKLALAESNAAVDNLALGATAAGLDVARLGPAFRFSGPVRRLTIDARVAEGPHAASLEAIDREISRTPSGRGLGVLYDERRSLQALARDHILETCDVIATTFGSLARLAADLPEIASAVVDEVTQAIEPAIWSVVPITEHLVLAGDPHQLGPVVLEPGNPLEVGVLDRLRARNVSMPMLAEQHRMHSDIQATVHAVYGDAYTAHSSVSGHLLADLLDDSSDAGEILASTPVLFVDTTAMGEEAVDPVSRSIHNPLEVRLVAIALAELKRLGLTGHQIAVIAPYSAQVARLKTLPEAEDVEVATVNAFQGREAEAILMSFTRSNSDGEIGFLADRRRLTVAVTRARRLLWMCGDSATLSRHPEFAQLLDDVPVQSVWEPPWSAAQDR